MNCHILRFGYENDPFRLFRFHIEELVLLYAWIHFSGLFLNPFFVDIWYIPLVERTQTHSQVNANYPQLVTCDRGMWNVNIKHSAYFIAHNIKFWFWYSKLKAMRLFLTLYNHQPVELQCCSMNANTSMWMWRFDCIDTGWYNGKDEYDLLIENNASDDDWMIEKKDCNRNGKQIVQEGKQNTNTNKWQQHWFKWGRKIIDNIISVMQMQCFVMDVFECFPSKAKSRRKMIRRKKI